MEMNRICRLAVLALLFCASCGIVTDDSSDAPVFQFTPSVEWSEVTGLPLNASWQIQYSGDLDLSVEADVYNLDLFDTNIAVIDQLHQRGIFVMCYFSAGSYEDWRTDANQFPQDVLGSDMIGWPGEKWLDIRQISILKPIMDSRLDLALQKNCDGVDPDNVNGFQNDTGFPLTSADQLAFNIYLADAAHARGLQIGLKNDLDQITDLLPYFDWALNEECFSFNECQKLLPFVQAGKPVFVIEYELGVEDFCPQANEMNFNALWKNWELDAERSTPLADHPLLHDPPHRRLEFETEGTRWGDPQEETQHQKRDKFRWLNRRASDQQATSVIARERAATPGPRERRIREPRVPELLVHGHHEGGGSLVPPGRARRGPAPPPCRMSR